MSTKFGFALFETTLGHCGIAWSENGIVGVQLPELPPGNTRGSLTKRFSSSRESLPPEPVKQTIEDIQALLRGEAKDLTDALLDLSGVPEFHRRIYAITRTIQPGMTLTYGEIAARLDEPGWARVVGQAMGSNPIPIIIPCHRVLGAGGETGGFSGPGGVATKLRLLAIEGAPEMRGPFEIEPGIRSIRQDLFGPTLPFDADQAVIHLRTADPVLARLIDQVGPLQLQLNQTSSLFGALVEAIVYQQLTAKAAATIFGQIKALFPHTPSGPTPEQILHVPDEKLRGAGLSQAKLRALRDLASRTVAGEIPNLAELLAMDDESIIERLLPVRGIGRWTVEMLLIFRLGRPDILPTDDYGIRKAYGLVFGTTLPSAHELLAAGETWRPFRTAASWYLWRALELPKA